MRLKVDMGFLPTRKRLCVSCFAVIITRRKLPRNHISRNLGVIFIASNFRASIDAIYGNKKARPEHAAAFGTRDFELPISDGPAREVRRWRVGRKGEPERDLALTSHLLGQIAIKPRDAK